MPIALSHLTKQAKHLATLLPQQFPGQKPLSLADCQAMVASMNGFPNWHAAQENCKKNALKKQRSKFAERVRTTCFDLAAKLASTTGHYTRQPVSHDQIHQSVFLDNFSKKFCIKRLCDEGLVYMNHEGGYFTDFIYKSMELIELDLGKEKMAASSRCVSIASSLRVGITRFKPGTYPNQEHSDRYPGWYSLNFSGLSINIANQVFETAVRKMKAVHASSNWTCHDLDQDEERQMEGILLTELLNKATISFYIARTHAAEFLLPAMELINFDMELHPASSMSLVTSTTAGLPVELTRFKANPAKSHGEFYTIAFPGAEIHYSAATFTAAIEDLKAAMPHL